MARAEISDLRRTIGELRQCLGALRNRYGDEPAVRRLINDIERLDIDADEFEGTHPVPQESTTRANRSDVVMMSDAPYDPSLWVDADDEGVGGYHGKRL